MPWVLHERNKQRRKQKTWRASAQTWKHYLSCADCQRIPEWGCGHLLERERMGTFPREEDWPTGDICPGYLVSLPQVGEIALLHRWWDKCQLVVRLGGRQPSELVMVCIDILANEIGALEACIMEAPREDRRMD